MLPAGYRRGGNKRRNHVEEVVDVANPAASSEIGTPRIVTMIIAPEAMYVICWFLNVDFQKLVDEHKLTRGKPSLNSVNLVLGDER